MKNKFIAAALAALTLSACVEQSKKNSAQITNEAQERQLQEAAVQVPVPAITNWREKRTLKMIYELRDKADLTTYTYLTAQNSGELKLLCTSLGFPINDATGFSSPDYIARSGHSYGYAILMQAEPNGLFTPDSSNGYWVICLDPEGGKPSPVFVTGYPVVSPFKLR
jgi:hypothetical protein